MENEPVFEINTGEQKIPCNRENASLFMFWGELASRNHIFVHEPVEDGEDKGVYVFSQSAPESFNRIATFMINNGFTSHINLQRVPDCDEQAYQQYVDQAVAAEQVPDELPDWMDNGND